MGRTFDGTSLSGLSGRDCRTRIKRNSFRCPLVFGFLSLSGTTTIRCGDPVFQTYFLELPNLFLAWLECHTLFGAFQPLVSARLPDNLHSASLFEAAAPTM